MGIGSICLAVRQKLGHGLRVAYWRDVVRPRILQTRPVSGTTDGTCEIHVLTSQSDWLNLIWTLKSFYLFSGRRYRLCIHDDGSLSGSQKDTLRQHFPDARMVDRPAADGALIALLQAYPRCANLRATNLLALKLFDFANYLASERMLLLDSDVLFFQSPTELVRRIDDPGYRKNSANEDVQSAYTVDPSVVWAQCNLDLVPKFNSGLGLIHKDSIRLDWIEEFLSLPGIGGHFWRIEQTLFALCSSRFGVELLPPEYAVSLGDGLSERPCRHYVGAIRQRLYGEGIRRLCRARFLENLTAGTRP